MKQRLRSLISGLAIASASVASTGIASAAIIPFDANGVLTDGSILSGTVTIDNSTGSATALNLVFSAPTSLTFDLVDRQGQVGSTTYQIQAGLASPSPDFNIALPVASLIGYMGGHLCSTSNFNDCQWTSNIYYSSSNYMTLQSGSLSVRQAVPEPASLALLALGLAGLGISRRKKA